MSKRSTLLMRIEKLIIFFLTELRNARLLPLQIPALSSCGDLQEIMETDDNLFSMGEKKIFRYIDSPQSSRIYAQLMAVIALVAELQTLEKSISQRDVYYSLKSLFKSQAECNKVIIDVGLLLGARRYEMGIVPASRGFIAGNVSYRFNVDGAETTSWVDCTAMGSGDASQSICSAWADSTKRVDILSNAKCILVIEKEGVFRRYDKSIYDVNTAIENLRMIPSILITGCGFPDIATRASLSRISNVLNIPVLGICDYNPFGAALLMTYKRGSISKLFEGDGYQTPSLRWIALHASHVKKLCCCSLSTDIHGNNISAPTFVVARDDMTYIEPRSTDLDIITRLTALSGSTIAVVEDLTPLDRRKLILMITKIEYELSRMLDATGSSNQEYVEYIAWYNELKLMAKVDKKCDLESLYALGIGYLTSFVYEAVLMHIK